MSAQIKSAIPRVRNIRDAVKEIREADPMSPVSEHMLRRAIKEQRLPYVCSGRNLYVDLAAVAMFLRGEL